MTLGAFLRGIPVPLHAMGKRKEQPEAAEVAPKKAPKVKAANSKAKAKAVSVSPAATSPNAINANIQAYLAQCDAQVLAHPSFNSIMKEQPTSKCGHLAYDPKIAGERLSQGLDYVAAAPLHWLNLNWEVQPNLPKYKSRIDDLQRHFFERPAYLKVEVRVVLPDKSCRPHEMVGSLLAYDPPEMRDSLRQACSQAIESGADDSTLEEWRGVLLSVPMRFTVVESDQEHKIDLMMKTLVQEREDIGVLFDNLRVSALMRTFEVIDMKAQLEKDGGERQTNKSLAAYYKTLRYCKKSEKVSPTFVEISLSLHKNALCYDKVRNICLRFDEMGLDNPLDSVYKLREIMIKSDKSRQNMEWAFSMTWDWFHVAGGTPGDGHGSRGCLIIWVISQSTCRLTEARKRTLAMPSR